MASNLSPAAFLYRSGEERNFPFPDRPQVRVGFDRTNDVAVPFEGVSRRHARISFDGKAYWIEDLGSSNGTFLNGRRLVRKQRLAHLDVVTLGRYADLIFVRRQIPRARATQSGIQSAWLLALDGPEAGSRREIPRGSITIGRSLASNVVVDSHLVSKSHARLERSGLQLVVIDLQSSNATFVNGERIDSKALADGDEISLGGGRTYRVRIDKGPIEVGEESQISAPTTAAKPLLPTDWKTRIEWSPEEKVVFDEFIKGSMERGKTVPRPAVDDKSAAAKPSAAPPRQTEAKATPAEPVSKPPAPREVSLPTPPRPAAPREVSLPTPPRPAAPKEVSLPAPPRPAAPKEVSLPAPPKPAAPKEVSLPTPPRPAAPREVLLPTPKPTAPTASPAPVSATPASSPEPAKKPPAQPSPPPSAPSARPAPAAQSVPSRRVSLEGKTERFAVGLGDHDVGRLPQCSIYIQGPQISRRHAVLHVTAGAVVVEDLGSANGTFVNGKKITGQHPLANDDHVQFGDTGFRVRIG